MISLKNSVISRIKNYVENIFLEQKINNFQNIFKKFRILLNTINIQIFGKKSTFYFHKKTKFKKIA
jgi:hypothetical protein